MLFFTHMVKFYLEDDLGRIFSKGATKKTCSTTLVQSGAKKSMASFRLRQMRHLVKSDALMSDRRKKYSKKMNRSNVQLLMDMIFRSRTSSFADLRC